MISLFTNHEEPLCLSIPRVARNRLGARLQRNERNLGKALGISQDSAPRHPDSLIDSSLYGMDHG